MAAAAALWAVAAVVARRLFDAGVSPVELTESRAVLACAGFALVPAAWRRPERTARRQVVALGVALALVNVTYYLAISRIPVAVALVVQYTAPVLVVAWSSVVARRAPSPDVLAASVASLVGVVLVADLFSAKGSIDALGLATALASAVFFASYTVLAEKTGAVYGSSGAMLRGFAVATLVWVAFQTPRGVPEALLEASNSPEILYLGLAGTLLPFLLYAWGVNRVRAERAAIAATLEPVIAAVVAWAWLGQRLSAVQILGGVLVVGAVVSLQVRPRRLLIEPGSAADSPPISPETGWSDARLRSGRRNSQWPPRVSVMADTTKPSIEIPPDESPPSGLVIEDITEGDGDEARPGHNVEVHYVGVAWSTGRQFDASWDRGQPFQFELGQGRVINGWDEGVAGMKVGGRRKLTIPPHMGYGRAGAGTAIRGNETLVFVVDLLGFS